MVLFLPSVCVAGLNSVSRCRFAPCRTLPGATATDPSAE